MFRFTKKIGRPALADVTATLTLDQRMKSRSRIALDDGREAGIFLERGESLKEHDCLATEDGMVVKIKAAPELVSRVETDDPLSLARACYHLGNRHVAVQIEAGRLRYLHDRVLDEMVRGLGLEVRVEHAPFEPEPGAYGARAQAHEGHVHQR